jgi:hypothetical protein
MSKIIVAVLLIATPVACFAQSQAESEAIDTAKERILANLKDPDSVKFRNVKAFENGAVCGEYNARNSYGGYVGYKHFGYTASGASIKPPMENLTGDYAKYASDAFYTRCAEAK